MNAPDKCPHCSSRVTAQTSRAVRYICGWTIYDPSTNQTMWARPFGCIEAERDQLAARVKELEAYAARLEKLGDQMTPDTTGDMKEAWELAKETKP